MNDGLFDNVLLAFDELDEAVMMFTTAPASHAPNNVWMKLRAARQREEFAHEEEEHRLQQEAEIRAETNIPQHLVW